MKIKFTDQEIETIQDMMATMSDDEIAQAIGCSVVSAVRDKIREIANLPGLDPPDSAGDQVPEPEQPPAPVLKKKRGPKIRQQKSAPSPAPPPPAPMPAYTKPKKRAEPVLPSKPVDTTGQIAVRIDSRTTVYVKPGTDMAKVYARFHKP